MNGPFKPQGKILDGAANVNFANSAHRRRRGRRNNGRKLATCSFERIHIRFQVGETWGHLRSEMSNVSKTDIPLPKDRRVFRITWYGWSFFEKMYIFLANFMWDLMLNVVKIIWGRLRSSINIYTDNQRSRRDAYVERVSSCLFH